MSDDLDETDDGSLGPDPRDIEHARLKAEHAEMRALLREVAVCEADDITVVLPFELQDRVRALLDRIDGGLVLQGGPGSEPKSGE